MLYSLPAMWRFHSVHFFEGPLSDSIMAPKSKSSDDRSSEDQREDLPFNEKVV